jgi:hypothetical protein
MKRNDNRHISPADKTQYQGQCVAFISKDYPDETPDESITTTIIASSYSYNDLWTNSNVLDEYTRIDNLDQSGTNTLNEVVIIDFVNFQPPIE